MKDNSVTVKEYFTVQINDIKDSIKIAYTSMEKRLDGMNEFRDTLKDQAGKFITREEYDSKHTQLQQQVNTIQKAVWIGIGFVMALELLLKFFIP